jgi:hypothetical protein
VEGLAVIPNPERSGKRKQTRLRKGGRDTSSCSSRWCWRWCGSARHALWAPAASARGGVSVSNLVVSSVTVDPQTKLATARGAVMCTGARRAYVGIEVIQTVGRVHSAQAYGDKRIVCDGRVRFSIGLTNYEGRLGPGDATVNGYAEAFSRFGYDSARFSGVLQVGKTS